MDPATIIIALLLFIIAVIVLRPALMGPPAGPAVAPVLASSPKATVTSQPHVAATPVEPSNLAPQAPASAPPPQKEFVVDSKSVTPAVTPMGTSLPSREPPRALIPDSPNEALNTINGSPVPSPHANASHPVVSEEAPRASAMDQEEYLQPTQVAQGVGSTVPPVAASMSDFLVSPSPASTYPGSPEGSLTYTNGGESFRAGQGRSGVPPSPTLPQGKVSGPPTTRKKSSRPSSTDDPDEVAARISGDMPMCPYDGMCMEINDTNHQQRFMHTCKLMPCYHAHLVYHTRLFKHVPGQGALPDSADAMRSTRPPRPTSSLRGPMPPTLTAMAEVRRTCSRDGEERPPSPTASMSSSSSVGSIAMINSNGPNSEPLYIHDVARGTTMMARGDWSNIRLHTLKRYIHKNTGIIPQAQCLMVDNATLEDDTGPVASMVRSNSMIQLLEVGTTRTSGPAIGAAPSQPKSARGQS